MGRLEKGDSWKKRYRILKVKPTGDPHSRVWFVGEAPGHTEYNEQDRCEYYGGLGPCEGKCSGHVFVGATGKTFDNWLEHLGLPRNEVYVCNAVPYWPGKDEDGKDRTPTYEEIMKSRWELLRQIERYQPEVVVAMGNVATIAMLHGWGGPMRQELLNGRPCVHPDRPRVTVFPITHPAAGLHDSFQAAQTWLGLKSVMSWLDKPWQWKVGKPIVVRLQTKEEVRSVLRGYTGGVWVDTEGYPGDRWSMQFVLDGSDNSYIIYVSDHAAIMAFVKYAPRPWTFHSVLGTDLDFFSEVAGIELEASDFEDTILRTYVMAQEPAKGDMEMGEGAVYSQSLKTMSFKYLLLKEQMPSWPKMVAPHYNRVVSQYIDRLWADAVRGKVDCPIDTPRSHKLDRRILNMLWQEDTAKRWNTLMEEKPAWRDIVFKHAGPTPKLKLTDIPTAEFEAYACDDPHKTRELDKKVLIPTVRRMNLQEPYELDKAVVPMLNEMQHNGLLVNKERLWDLQLLVQKTAAEVRERLVEAAAKKDLVDFNPGSPDQVSTMLYEKYGVKGFRRTKGGDRFSSDEKTMMSLALEKDSPEAQFRADTLDYRGLTKLLGTYILPMWEMIEGDGRIHPQWRNTIAVTGRLAERILTLIPSRNVPGEPPWATYFRRIFEAAPGWVYVAADLSQIELRFLASESKDPLMLKAYREGLDLHKLTVKNVLHLDPESAEGKDRRVSAKTANFACCYGITPPGLQMRLATMKVFETLEYCEKLVSGKKAEWRTAFDYLEAAGDECANDPDLVVRAMGGRMRYLPMVVSPVEKARAEAYRQAGNHKVQAGAQWVEKMGMIECWNRREEMPGIKWLLQMHDDTMSEIREEHALKYASIIQECFEKTVQHKFVIPIKAGVKVGSNWGDMKEVA